MDKMDSDNKDQAQKKQKNSKKELFKNFDILKNNIISLRNELNKINKDKEMWFDKKEIFSNSFKEKIKSIRENKSKRDDLTKKVKELKGKRYSLNDETRKKISEFKNLSNEKNKLISKSKIKNPQLIKGEIDKVEIKLETEAMSFDKEKKLYKNLKVLKKSLGETSQILNLFDIIKILNKEINESKKNTENIHNEIQVTAKQSQEMHESILKNSKEIDELKPKEREAFRNFINYRKKFIGINNNLKKKLREMSTIREKINKFELEEEEKKKLKDSILIKSKEHEFEEKIRTGKKLTTDDFLAFQDIIKNKK